MRDNLRHRLNRMTPLRVGVLDSIRIGNSHQSKMGFSYNLFFSSLIVLRRKSNVVDMDSEVQFKRVSHALNERQDTEDDSTKAVAVGLRGNQVCSVESYS